MEADICYVYWIRLDEHTDITKEGYIGISSSPTQRLSQHIYAATSNRANYNDEFSEALISGNFIKEVLICSTRDYCFDLEAKLRPTWKIGWNLARGGLKGGIASITYDLDGNFYNLMQLSEMSNIKPDTIYKRILRGWSIKEALGIKQRKKIKEFNYKAEMAIFYLENSPMTCLQIAKILEVNYNLKILLKNYNVPKYLFEFCNLPDRYSLSTRRIRRSLVFKDFDTILDVEEKSENNSILNLSKIYNVSCVAINNLLEELKNE